MACDCISKLNQAFREESGDPKAAIDVGFKHDKAKGTLEVRPVGLVMRGRVKNQKNQQLSIRAVKIPLALNFCPWCGTKYD